jgi:putative oxidoreductase
MLLLGVKLSEITLIFLLIGQRLAKGYARAISFAAYLIITALGVFI